MKIVIAGGTGFIGEPLVRRLLARGDVVVLTRDPSHVRAGRAVPWSGGDRGQWTGEIAAADVVINLAGENIAGGRWTEDRKRLLVASRIDATGALVAAMEKAPGRERTFVSASAVGYYGDRRDETLHESAKAGSGFLAELTTQWEESARLAEPIARVVILRFGVVLGKEGGALAKMLLPFKMGVGGPIGSGSQWMSWIDRHDALRMIEWAIDNRNVRGIYNATAPEPVRNGEFVAELGKALHRPAFMRAPAFAIKLAFGSMAEEVLLAGQRVVPKRAMEEGFAFEFRTLRQSLSNIF
jgi:uncharacterized protein (TIGR01777 family)